MKNRKHRSKQYRPAHKARRRRKLSVRVRPPKDYPWKVLSCLIEAVSPGVPPEYQQAIGELVSITRARDLAKYEEWSSHWSLQSISKCELVRWPRYAAIMYQLGSLVRKYQFEGSSLSRRESAIRTVIEGDRICSDYNRGRYRILFRDGKPTSELELMREFVSLTLGDTLPEFDDLTKMSRHGPGATTSSSGGRVSAYHKYADWPYDVTAGALERSYDLIMQDERWRGALEESYRQRYGIAPWEILDFNEFKERIFRIVPGNKITTVPKDAHTDRPIAIEPTCNQMLQLGVDGYVRRRLRRWGIDLDDQSRNRELAFEGSIRDDWMTPVTIDLSMASDTISLRLAKIVLPAPWYRLLCAIRSPSGLLPDGRRLRFSKLSSMGNGSTFAIESLIFAAVVYAACKTTLGYYPRASVAVFGDDLCLPQSCATWTCKLLEACGFRVNTTKSFLFGACRESCGTDWIRGTDVRPVFLKNRPTIASHLYTDFNRLSRWLELMFGQDYEGLKPLRETYRSWIPNHLWLVGPRDDESFDAYVHGGLKPSIGKDGWYTWRVLIPRPIPRKGPELPFRKLMHPLRPRPPQAVSDSGNVFDVYHRGSVEWIVSTRRATTWQDEYRLVSPVRRD
jgi:hypothetical protein